jgi:hypothetical protein
MVRRFADNTPSGSPARVGSTRKLMAGLLYAEESLSKLSSILAIILFDRSFNLTAVGFESA